MFPQAAEASPARRARTYAKEIWQKTFQTKVHHPVPAPKLYIMAGLPLTGKSFLARRIMKLSPADLVYIENDHIRKTVVKMQGKTNPVHDKAESALTYETSHNLISLSLKAGFHTIFDATNLNEHHRRKLYAIADEAGAQCLIIKTYADAATARERSRARASDHARVDHSDADFSIYELLGDEDEPIEKCRTRSWLLLDTSKKTADELIRKHGLLLR